MKKMNALDKNKEYSEKVIQKIINPIIPKEIKKIILVNKNFSLIDLGCGDGALIQAIKKEFPKIRVSGIDISPRRIGDLRKKFPKDKFYCKDVCNTHLKKESFDLINSSQVIEHVANDKKFIQEMDRLLKKGGFLFVDSVIKKPWAVYKYKNRKGKFVLDPTHEREYKNISNFLNLFKDNFKLIKYWTIPVKRKFLFINIKIPGYYLIYGIWRKI